MRSTRRAFLGLGGAAALSACAAHRKQDRITFWDMPWGPPEYSALAGRLVHDFGAPKGLRPMAYQSIQWANYYQTFAAAIASHTGPSVSSGAAFLAFQFADQGAIAYLDDLVGTLHKSGESKDFLPGTIDSLKTSDGYVGVPWQIDMRVLWYRKSLLRKAGVEPPTDWDSYITVGKALKKIGVIGYGTGAGSGNNLGAQAIVGLMINNGGGMFDDEGNPDCVTDRNIETLEFLAELHGHGIIDPGAVSFTGDNLNSGWTSGRIGMGFDVPDLPTALGDRPEDYAITSPLTGPHGDKGALYYVNNLMMYKATPDKPATEHFLQWYLGKMKEYWDQGLLQALPVRHSIVNSSKFQANTNSVKAVKEWQPIAKTFSARGSRAFPELAAVDGGQAIVQFTQKVLQGDTAPKKALEALQTGLRPLF